MASRSRLPVILCGVWRWLRVPFWLGAGLAVGFLGPYLWTLDGRVRQRFGELTLSEPTRVFARPLWLGPGTPMNANALEIELTAAGYQHASAAHLPGSWSAAGNTFTIASRGFVDPAGGELPRRVRVATDGDHVTALTDLTSGQTLRHVRLDPARIATLYGASQEERQLVQLKDVPPLLLAGLQAVEDRDFKHHHGIDLSAIARAAWANLRAGHVVQGGSTLTQQLVRNLFLDRNQNLARKLNEAALALLIEAHYDKGRILEAYVNEVFLGQRGNQAVHGFAAASQFYFGRRMQFLRTPEIALLVGMVQGPSYYDPRRHPQRALARRNVALRAFAQTGLINPAELDAALAAPLGVSAEAQLPHDRFPAFMQLVRQQIAADFDEATLRQGGLTIFTTLDPAAQILAERALDKTLDGLGKRGAALEGAVVVTDAGDGGVLAVVGGRNAAEQGFNRALDARRPIGSLVKPFVYLIALADPKHWSLASLLDDTPVNMRLPNGSVWSPENDDHQSHGKVPLVDALAHSWNLATVHLGMQLGLDRVVSLLRSLGIQRPIQANPSLLLGAVDLSPFDVAQMYQFLAADGHALPLIAVRGVLGKDGKPLKRYRVKPGAGEYHTATTLATYAMQQVAQSGTARAIDASSLSGLNAAGKTGTSDSQRDSWFAGFTGSHLAVAWVGRDDNKTTHLFGATGGLKVWINLFRALPTSALPAAPTEGVEYAFVDPVTGLRTTPDCPGARRLPFAAGYAPAGPGACLQQRFQDIYQSDNPNPDDSP
ncbi:MAG TPA: penicillin-binding protein 1B [Rhodanobacteraceae bacterium]|nr:penicillin-binding protein 1B [Rhodanobacteraceae bacterium]